MSATAQHATVPAPVREPRPAQAAPTLRVLPTPAAGRPARARAPKAPFVVLVCLLLAGGLVGLLLLNTVVDQDAFRLHALQSGQSALDVQEAQLRETADADADPAALAAAAAKLGMVPAGPPQFVRAAKLPKGQRIGNLVVVPAAAPTANAATGTTTGAAGAAVAPAAGAPAETAAPETQPTAADVAPTASTASHRPAVRSSVAGSTVPAKSTRSTTIARTSAAPATRTTTGTTTGTTRTTRTRSATTPSATSTAAAHR